MVTFAEMRVSGEIFFWRSVCAVSALTANSVDFSSDPFLICWIYSVRARSLLLKANFWIKNLCFFLRYIVLHCLSGQISAVFSRKCPEYCFFDYIFKSLIIEPFARVATGKPFSSGETSWQIRSFS
jgi:hypothetical protein